MQWRKQAEQRALAEHGQQIKPNLERRGEGKRGDADQESQPGPIN